MIRSRNNAAPQPPPIGRPTGSNSFSRGGPAVHGGGRGFAGGGGGARSSSPFRIPVGQTQGLIRPDSRGRYGSAGPANTRNDRSYNKRVHPPTHPPLPVLPGRSRMNSNVGEHPNRLGAHRPTIIPSRANKRPLYEASGPLPHPNRERTWDRPWRVQKLGAPIGKPNSAGRRMSFLAGRRQSTRATMLSSAFKRRDQPPGSRPGSHRRCSLLPDGTPKKSEERLAATPKERVRSASTSGGRGRKGTMAPITIRTTVATGQPSASGSRVPSAQSQRDRRTSVQPVDEKDMGGGWNKSFTDNRKAKRVSEYTPSIMSDSAIEPTPEIKRRPLKRRPPPPKPAVLGKDGKPLKSGAVVAKPEIKSGKVGSVDQERARQLIALLSGATYEYVGSSETQKTNQVYTDLVDKPEWLKTNNKKSEKKDGKLSKGGETAASSERVGRGGSASKTDPSAAQRRRNSKSGTEKDDKGSRSGKEDGTAGTSGGPAPPRRKSRSERGSISKGSGGKGGSALLPPLISLADPVAAHVFRARPVTAITEEEEEQEMAALLADLARSENAKASAAAAAAHAAAIAAAKANGTGAPVFQMPYQSWGVRRPMAQQHAPPMHFEPQYTYKTYLDSLMHPNIFLPPCKMPPMKQILYGPYEEQLWKMFYGQAGWLTKEALEHLRAHPDVLLSPNMVYTGVQAAE
ncbi:hypothetical protein DFS34DRAFT_639687 [Phlyctochytrium arcticum]|nr:hypothetical protein DFS34DRAFT_639687 [Phlyctochytrium arcticum]